MATLRLAIMIVLIGVAALSGCTLNRQEKVAATSGVEESKADAIEKARPAPPPRISPDTHMAAGRMLEKQGDLNAAVAQYERAIAAEPRQVAAYNRLGIVYQKLGRFEDSDNMFRAGLRADPGSAAIYNNLGYSFLLRQRFEEAAEQFRHALTIEPDFDRARMNYAIALGYLGRMDESAVEFSRVVSPDIAHYNIAMLELHRGNLDAARRALSQALAKNPDCPGAAEQLRKIDALAASEVTSNPPAASPRNTLAGQPSQEADIAP